MTAYVDSIGKTLYATNLGGSPAYLLVSPGVLGTHTHKIVLASPLLNLFYICDCDHEVYSKEGYILPFPPYYLKKPIDLGSGDGSVS